MNYFPKNSARTLKSFMNWFQGAGTPKLLLVMAPQNHFIQLAKWFWGGGQSVEIMMLSNLHPPLPGDGWVKHLTWGERCQWKLNEFFGGEVVRPPIKSKHAKTSKSIQIQSNPHPLTLSPPPFVILCPSLPFRSLLAVLYTVLGMVQSHGMIAMDLHAIFVWFLYGLLVDSIGNGFYMAIQRLPSTSNAI